MPGTGEKVAILPFSFIYLFFGFGVGFFVCLFVCFVGFLGLHMWHMEVPRLGVKSELQLPAYTTATATWDPSHVFDLHHSSWQCQILSPLSKARDTTCILMDIKSDSFPLSHGRNSYFYFVYKFICIFF